MIRFTFLYFVNRVEAMVVDIGAPADWVKINVQRTVSSFYVSR